MKRNKTIDVRRALALASTFNFLCSCASACLLPFLTLYLRQLGLTPAMTGIVMGAKHVITLVWSPASSLLSKHYNKRRAVIGGSLVCSAAAALVLLFFPATGVHTHTCNMTDVRTQSAVTSSVTPATLLRTHPKVDPSPVSRSAVTPPAETLAETKSAAVTTTKTDDKSRQLPQEETSAAVVRAGEPKTSSSVTPQTTTAAPSRNKKSERGEKTPDGEQTVTLAEAKSAADTTRKAALDRHDEDKSRRQDDVSAAEKPRTSSSVTLKTISAAPVRNKRSERGEKTTDGEQTEGEFEFLGSLKVMDPQHQLFFLVLITVSVWEVASAPLEWTADDGLYEYLDFADASDRYSSTGVWGLLGAACGVGGAGVLVSQLRCLIAGQTPRSAVHFCCYAALCALTLPAAACLPLYLNKKRDRANGLLKAVQLVRGSPRALLCAVTALLVGVTNAAVENFLLWQMQDHGSSELHMGLSLALALLSQAAFPLLAPRVSKLLSPGRVLAVAAASLGLQCFYYSFLWGPWAALPAQVLSCFSGGALWWAVRMQCEDIATPGAERSVRRVYGALSLRLGGAMGSFGGGFVVQRFGLAWLFRGAALGVMAWCVCLPLLQWKAPRQRRINYSRLLAADASEASDSESEQERDWLEKAMEDDRSNNNYGRRTNH
ncbi:major facilitator superfamily domain-containing protein 6-like [Plectropomus leopardus]|uniref:major facilitator superfamily domain-containing protein 6-like n=1 Tax=Plectropomus leopardus TaxID=160734 RepID=UPI001C4DA0B3|nr:major facilitator superfamily domain-containing protein 6-like [Plectropomus leopardus]